MPEILRSTRTTWMQIVGLALIAASLLVFGWARNAIKGMYSGRIRVQAGHSLDPAWSIPRYPPPRLCFIHHHEPGNCDRVFQPDRSCLRFPCC